MTLLPTRAHHIGSLIRPAYLLDVRAKVSRQLLEQDELREAEEKAIAEAIELQERIGLTVITDGEYRRRTYHSYFFSQLGDIRPDVIVDEAAHVPGKKGAQPQAVVRSRVSWTKPIHVSDYEFIARRANANSKAKITIPGPCAVHYRGGDQAVLASAYDDVEKFWDDMIAAFRSELLALADAGCGYVQIDETAFAKFGDPDVQAWLAARGDDWSALIDKYIRVTNEVVRGLPSSLKIGMHLCRGNRTGVWHAEGSYEAVAERLFNGVDVDFFLLEFDSPRAGSFHPLRFVPSHKGIVLGLVSTKSAELENRSALLKRIDDATKYVDLARLAVSPQCGFAAGDTGGAMTADQQEQKLRLVVDIADEVWGRA